MIATRVLSHREKNLKRRCAIAAVSVVAMVAATTDAMADCEALLRDGVYDARNVTSQTLFAEQLRANVCRSDVTTLAQAQSWGGDATIPVEGILVEFGFNTSRSNFSEAKSRMCQALSQDRSFSSTISERMRTANAELARAFVDCMQARTGLIAWLEPEPSSIDSTAADPLRFSLHYRYQAGYNAPMKVTVDGAAWRNADCMLPPERGLELRHAQQASAHECTRTDPNQPVQITIRTAEGFMAALRMPVIRERQPPPPPGSIRVVSALLTAARMEGGPRNYLGRFQEWCNNRDRCVSIPYRFGNGDGSPFPEFSPGNPKHVTYEWECVDGAGRQLAHSGTRVSPDGMANISEMNITCPMSAPP